MALIATASQNLQFAISCVTWALIIAMCLAAWEAIPKKGDKK